MTPRRKELVRTYLISAMIVVFGVILISYYLLWVGIILILIACGMIITKHFTRERGERGVRSFWAFDRPEKGEWEDVDRVIRR